MTATELRAMAQRIVDEYDDPDAIRPAICKPEPAEVQFARHILATTAEDDDQPLSDDWVMSIGGRRVHKHAFDFDLDADGIAVLLFPSSSGPWWRAEIEDAPWPVNMKTRGDVRRLLSALRGDAT